MIALRVLILAVFIGFSIGLVNWMASATSPSERAIVHAAANRGPLNDNGSDNDYRADNGGDDNFRFDNSSDDNDFQDNGGDDNFSFDDNGGDDNVFDDNGGSDNNSDND